jgi:hypothetical protein
MNLNSSKIRVLNLFIKNPNKEFYLSQVRKKTGLSLDRTHAYLKYWKKAGALSFRRCGRMTFYKLRKCRIVELIKGLIGELNA